MNISFDSFKTTMMVFAGADCQKIILGSTSLTKLSELLVVHVFVIERLKHFLYYQYGKDVTHEWFDDPDRTFGDLYEFVISEAISKIV